MIKQLIQTVYATNAEVSAQQDLALQTGTKNIQNQMGDINRMMGATEEGMKIISALVSVCCVGALVRVTSFANFAHRISSLQ
jgi:hypothetical protein